MRPWEGVLFDLDGTLLDTARDLGGALNDLLVDCGRSPLPAEQIRPWASHGSGALIRLAFGLTSGKEFEALRQRFLDRYAERIALETCLFPGGEALLDAIEGTGLRWGIVTNKPAFLTDPLLAALGLDRRAACVVSGDTLPQKKPHPAPLLHAAALAGLDPADCVYLGDAERDVQAARAAGMTPLVALFGYLGDHDQPANWGAAASVDSLADFATWLGLGEPSPLDTAPRATAA